jgi:hypothetical protein
LLCASSLNYLYFLWLVALVMYELYFKKKKRLIMYEFCICMLEILFANSYYSKV